MAPPRRKAADNTTPQDVPADNQPLPEALSLAQLRQKTISHPTQQVQITMYVPPHTVGAVIGRGGRTIVSVQREAMRCNAGHVTPIRISVLNDSSNTTREDYHQQQHNNNESSSDNNQVATDGYNDTTWSNTDDSETKLIEEDDEWTPVVIKGDPVGCFSACRQLVTIVEEENDPEIVLDIPILKSKHNMVVGKGGIVLAALSAQHETRIMVPPNEFMSNVTGPEDNIWKQREAAQNDPGMSMLFSNNDEGNTNPNIMEQLDTLPPDIIQLEGEIDKVERCLVKMLNIIAGETYIPTGVIVTTNKSETTQTKSAAKINKDDTYAEAVIVKIWTPNSKLLNLGKIRKVQRKTNTVIRRKKLRFRGNIDGTSSVSIVNEEGESDDDDDDDDNEGGETVGEEENDGEEEEEGEVKDEDDEVSGPKQTATKYIITGKTESVKIAATQFEKILGLEAGSATINDTTHKVRSMVDVGSGDDDGGEKIVKKKRPKKKLTKEQKEANKTRKEAKIKAAKQVKKEKRLRAFARKKAQKQAETNSSDV